MLTARVQSLPVAVYLTPFILVLPPPAPFSPLVTTSLLSVRTSVFLCCFLFFSVWLHAAACSQGPVTWSALAVFCLCIWLRSIRCVLDHILLPRSPAKGMWAVSVSWPPWIRLQGTSGSIDLCVRFRVFQVDPGEGLLGHRGYC